MALPQPSGDVDSPRPERAGGIASTVLAHDIANLMMNISAHCYLTRKKEHLPSSAIQRLSMIEEQAKKAALLCQEVIAMQTRTFLVRTLVDEVADTLRSQVFDHVQVNVEASALDELCVFTGQYVLLRQAILNLGGNAIDAIGDNVGTVTIGACKFIGSAPNVPHGEYLKIDVIDDGCGMSDETQSRLFDAHFSSKPNGSGLGMGIVRYVVDAHSGFINMKSTPGIGTEFHLYLPFQLTPTAVPLYR